MSRTKRVYPPIEMARDERIDAAVEAIAGIFHMVPTRAEAEAIIDAAYPELGGEYPEAWLMRHCCLSLCGDSEKWFPGYACRCMEQSIIRRLGWERPIIKDHPPE